jgi:uncharacterized membrane protein
MCYCSQCGKQVAEADLFCSQCGSRQPVIGGPRAAYYGRSCADPLAGISPRKMAIFCYIPVAGCAACVIALGSRRVKNDRALRFHAFQGLYIFAAYLLVEWTVQPIFASLPNSVFRLDQLLELFLFGVWVFMMIKTKHGEAYSLPLIGELAHRSAQERI